jgi:hypothetical protein
MQADALGGLAEGCDSINCSRWVGFTRPDAHRQEENEQEKEKVNAVLHGYCIDLSRVFPGMPPRLTVFVKEECAW